ncbi:SRR1-like protein [Anopheles albimanus]|uniref:SRR1-like protein n=1 Tax=Anopheles albimanus TaxID=7167 RepID=UPI00164024BE|nr:SRR1-like protein [Anopheles albimanus]
MRASAEEPQAGESTDDFKLVVTKKGHRRKTKGLPNKQLLHCTIRDETETNDSANRDTVISQLRAAETDLLQSSYFAECLEIAQPVLSNVERIVCLGLGRFSECSIARYQLAFLRCLRDKLTDPPGLAAQFFDPLFGRAELEVLHTLGETVLAENVEGKYSADCRTLFYLPHCPKQLVNNLLWKNWQPNKITNLVLICNSFSNVVNNHPHRLLSRSAGYILRAADVFTEFPLRNTFRFSDIFNDTSLHCAANVTGDELPTSAWENCEEPTYEGDDLELISQQLVERLVIEQN